MTVRRGRGWVGYCNGAEVAGMGIGTEGGMVIGPRTSTTTVNDATTLVCRVRLVSGESESEAVCNPLNRRMSGILALWCEKLLVSSLLRIFCFTIDNGLSSRSLEDSSCSPEVDGDVTPNHLWYSTRGNPSPSPPVIIPSNRSYGPPTLRALLWIESADVRPSIVRIPFISPLIAVDCSRHESNLRTPCYHPKVQPHWSLEAASHSRSLL